MASHLSAHPGVLDVNVNLPLHRFACLTAGMTLVLIFAGGLVTSTGSGLAVPDWPLSFGQVFPEMKGGVLYEHGHRLIASLVGLLTVVLATWVVLNEPRPGVRGLGIAAVLAVILQGILGGVTVLYKLPPAVSIVHACLAQGFLCLAVALAVVTGPGWATAARDGDRGLRNLAVATTLAVYAQLILGAIMRHTGAGLAVTNLAWPLGEPGPALSAPGVRIHLLHRLGATVVFALVTATVARALGSGRVTRVLRRPALLLGALVALQVALGASAVWTRKAPLPTTAHVATGAALLATSLVMALRAHRAVSPAARAEAS